MADDEAGPSTPKRPRQAPKRYYQPPLSDKELEKLLYDSDADIQDDDPEIIDSDDDYIAGESDASSEEVIENMDQRSAFSQIQVQQPTTRVQLQQTQAPTQPQPARAAAAVPPPGPKWSNNRAMKTFPFTKRMEFLVVPDGNAPIDFFNMLVDDHFYEMIAEETNAYAVDVFLSEKTSPSSRITRWHNVTPEELRIFFGVLLHMGTITTNRLQDYWKTSRLFSIPFFAAAMSRDRFLLIMRCLHFTRNPREGEPKPDDRLFKVRPLIEYFNGKMAELYYPDKNLSLDESMVLFRGRLSFRQYIKNKKHKYGIKLYILTEPCGTILKFAVYTGQLDDFGGKGHAANVVLHLLEGRLDVGHAVYMDNYYNSHDLAVKLLNRNTYCTGTLRAERKNTPPEIKSTKLKKGETIEKYSDDGVLIGKWRDKREVAYITTEFTDEMVTYRDKLDREKEKPAPIYEYNKYMGGVDRQDQLLSYYPCERKCLRWYKKLGIHIFQMLLINAHLLYKKHTKSKMSLYDFRLSVIETLVPARLPAPIPLETLHNIKKHPMDKTGKKAISRRCTWCYNHKKVEKRTSYYCPSCTGRPSLCVGDCFKNYHENL